MASKIYGVFSSYPGIRRRQCMAFSVDNVWLSGRQCMAFCTICIVIFLDHGVWLIMPYLVNDNDDDCVVDGVWLVITLVKMIHRSSGFDLS